MFAITALGSFLLMMNSLPLQRILILSIRYKKTTGKLIDLDAPLLPSLKELNHQLTYLRNK